MADRRQLPPQIKRVELEARRGGRPVVRYQLTVDVGNDADGKRKQFRKRYKTEAEARDALKNIQGDVAKGTYVHPPCARHARTGWRVNGPPAERNPPSTDTRRSCRW
ncbi:Arm DNA-binding domain-containing protein [Mycolicibacterium mageritense]|uniref:Arm DNA-binding domain-containing protein n=1 Tax=Mycolicibacterium mageritense TaxID=53462 RepID=UPI0023F27DF7|nr:Arm DNA-binding domain-containing protein [Mycolicibacterium mageritense]